MLTCKTQILANGCLSRLVDRFDMLNSRKSLTHLGMCISVVVAVNPLQTGNP